MQEITNWSKKLAFLLRHDSLGFEQGKIDKEGFRNVNELISDQNFTIELLEKIVNSDSKGRYEFNQEHTKIRARQGHSIPVDVGLEEKEPPEYLYHGTSTRFMDSIFEEGLKPQSRLYVHLSQDLETARKVGLRHGGQLLILTIKTGEMARDGIKFFQSKNGVWLVEKIDTKYIKMDIEKYTAYISSFEKDILKFENPKKFRPYKEHIKIEDGTYVTLRCGLGGIYQMLNEMKDGKWLMEILDDSETIAYRPLTEEEQFNNND